MSGRRMGGFPFEGGGTAALTLRTYAEPVNDFETPALVRVSEKLNFPPDLRRVMLRKLGHVDAAVRLEDLRSPPGNRLEKLKRDRDGQHSIRVNDQWRICFRWVGSDAYEVEIVDHH